MSSTYRPHSDPNSLVLPTTCDELDSAHVVQFYVDDAFLINDLSRFIGTALGAGDAALVIATETHRQRLAQTLSARGLNVAVAVEQGRYVVLDAAETLSNFMVDGWPDATRFSEVVGEAVTRAKTAVEGVTPRVAAFGEMVALLWAEGNSDAALRVEQLWNELATSHSFALRCAYPMSGFDREGHGEPLQRICAEHARVIPAESYTSLSSEEERLRTITLLQQKAQALENEVAERKAVQNSLQHREAELADFLENAVEGVQQVGSDQTILWANKSLLKLLGYSRDEYVGHSLADFHVDKHIFHEFWGRLMRREDICDFHAELRSKDGSVRHVLIHSNGLWEGERFVHTRCFVRDVTEQKRIEEVLRRTERMAAMGKLAASIAHEINNPLESVTNLFYLLKQHPSLDMEARRFAALADEELKRVAHITKQTLGFYRKSPHAVAVSVTDVLDAVLEAHVARLAKSRIAINKQYDTDEKLMAFPDELRQIFANLIGNAIEATGRDGQLKLHVFLSCNWANGGSTGIRINICDSGVGINEPDRTKIFEPFFTTKAEKGTGLGLWVTKGIVQKYDGSVRFRSGSLGGWSGTCFSVFLPSNAGRTHSAKSLAAA